MKKYIFTIISLGFILFSSCEQGNVLYQISLEQPPKTPLIDGSPSSLVKTANGLIYCANKTKLFVYEYENEKKWSRVSISGASGRLVDIAAIDDTLFLLTESGRTRTLYKGDSNATSKDSITFAELTNGSRWTPASLMAAGNYIFAAGQAGSTSEDYALLYSLASGSTLEWVETSANLPLAVGMLNDGTNDRYYVSFAANASGSGNGIKSAVPPEFSALASLPIMPDSNLGSGKGFLAFYNVGNELIATANSSLNNALIWKIQRDGSSGDSQKKSYTSVLFSRALGIWDDGTNKYLLIGRANNYSSTSTYYYWGYYTLPISGDSVDISGSLDTLGSAMGMEGEAYNSSIGYYGIHSFVQADSGGGTAGKLFASTMNNGLWMLINNDGYQWEVVGDNE
ncbi:MAG: hypothetical protein LBM77_01880 [Spirochaetaceae bacterium]|jgi:hypothetical protein|nr:hypothetical protein [Spirochaetaceae bacterium]